MLRFLGNLRRSVLLPLWPDEPYGEGWPAWRKGLWAERVVARRLWLRGASVRAHRWTSQARSDIDLVAATREMLLFAEVKFRPVEDEAPWTQVFDEDRQDKLRRAVGEYLRETRQRHVSLAINGYLVQPRAEEPRAPLVYVLPNVINPKTVPGWRGIVRGEVKPPSEPILLEGRGDHA